MRPRRRQGRHHCCPQIMKQYLLRVERPVVEFESLIAAARHEGERVGWLELPREASGPVPESLSAAANAGVLRAVAAGGGRSVAVKPLRGEPVLRDLLREHFRGCRLVLVTGEIDAPLLEPTDERRAGGAPTEQRRAGGAPAEHWMVRTEDGSTTRWTTERLTAALRKHRGFEART